MNTMYTLIHPCSTSLFGSDPPVAVNLFTCPYLQKGHGRGQGEGGPWLLIARGIAQGG